MCNQKNVGPFSALLSAGTRFRKRGVNNSGYVANDVETEQMLAAGVDRKTAAWLLSSVVQVTPIAQLQASEVACLVAQSTGIILHTYLSTCEIINTSPDSLHACAQCLSGRVCKLEMSLCECRCAAPFRCSGTRRAAAAG